MACIVRRADSRFYPALVCVSEWVKNVKKLKNVTFVHGRRLNLIIIYMIIPSSVTKRNIVDGMETPLTFSFNSQRWSCIIENRCYAESYIFLANNLYIVLFVFMMETFSKYFVTFNRISSENPKVKYQFQLNANTIIC